MLEASSTNPQIVVHKDERPKKTVDSHHSLQQFTKKLFGLQNVPAIFHCVSDTILHSLKNLFAPICFEDIFTFFKTPKELGGQREIGLASFKDTGVTLKLKKMLPSRIQSTIRGVLRNSVNSYQTAEDIFK